MSGHRFWLEATNLEDVSVIIEIGITGFAWFEIGLNG